MTFIILITHIDWANIAMSPLDLILRRASKYLFERMFFKFTFFYIYIEKTSFIFIKLCHKINDIAYTHKPKYYLGFFQHSPLDDLQKWYQKYCHCNPSKNQTITRYKLLVTVSSIYIHIKLSSYKRGCKIYWPNSKEKRISRDK